MMIKDATTRKSLLYAMWIMLSLAFGTKGYGQSIGDFEIRQELGVVWQPYKKFQLNPHYRLNTFDNSSRFKRSMFGIGAEYAIKKWIAAGGEYRYYMSYTKDYHRFGAFLKFSVPYGRFTLKDRLQYQQDQDYFDEKYLSFYPPQRVFRNKLVLNYGYTRKLSFYAYAEPFV